MTVRDRDCLMMNRLCVSLRARRIARAVTRHYDRHLERGGVTAAQLPILAFLHVRPGATLREIGDEFDLERSTLARNVALLVRRGLLEQTARGGPLPSTVRLTSDGEKALGHAWEAWQRAHAEVERLVPPAEIEEAFAVLERLSGTLAADGETASG